MSCRDSLKSNRVVKQTLAAVSVPLKRNPVCLLYWLQAERRSSSSTCGWRRSSKQKLISSPEKKTNQCNNNEIETVLSYQKETKGRGFTAAARHTIKLYMPRDVGIKCKVFSDKTNKANINCCQRLYLHLNKLFTLKLL